MFILNAAVAGFEKHNKEMEERLEEVEKECLSFTQQSTIDKNTLSALREVKYPPPLTHPNLT